MKPTLKEIAEKDYEKNKLEAIKRGAIEVTDKDQANQIFDDMKSREVAAFNHNHSETEKMLTEIRDKLHSENRPDSIKELQDLRDLIIEYIDIFKSIELTIHERTHFEENKHFIDRNKEYDSNAIKSLEISLEVVKDRIKRRETEQLNSLPKTLNSKLSNEQLLKLRDFLITGNYIGNISKAEFIYIFREQPIKGGMTVIQWRKSKVLAKRLLSEVTGETFSNPIANKCFNLYKNPENPIFDSNVVLIPGTHKAFIKLIRQL